MLDSFGAKMRRQREAQAIALAAIAEKTKIKQSLLEALERDDLSHWPTGLFRRAFIRAYASEIGADPDAAVREFLEAHPEPVDLPLQLPVAGRYGSNSSEASGGAPPTRFHSILRSAIGALRGRKPSDEADDPALPSLSALAARRLTPPVPIDRATSPACDPEPDVEAHAVEIAAMPSPSNVGHHEVAPAAESLEFQAQAPAAVDSIAGDSVVETNAAAPAEPVVAATDAQTTDAAAMSSEPPPAAPAAQTEAASNLQALAALCTSLAEAGHVGSVQPLLADAARLLDALGLIVWVWHAENEELTPTLAHGYSPKVLAQLPSVRRDDANATAAAFRACEPRVISGSTHSRGALVVPIRSPFGCLGVLAIELRRGGEESPAIRATASIVAALLAQPIAAEHLLVPAVNHPDAPDSMPNGPIPGAGSRTGEPMQSDSAQSDAMSLVTAGNH